MSPLDRLLLESVPLRPGRPPKPANEPWTPTEQAQHWAELCEAIRDWQWDDDTSLSKRRREQRRQRGHEAA
ncbi:hypothetical protein ABZV65_19725 [Streptomyces bauhiniae]|uniref:hypothetical protein n=1 Tax=Streptomyces bauhiniae TaxID=2340725 RepID=UPI0033B0A5FB